MLTKHNLCLFIKDEEHLEEMREFLECNGEKINDNWFIYYHGSEYHNYLQTGAFYKWVISNPVSKKQVTTEQFKNLFNPNSG